MIKALFYSLAMVCLLQSRELKSAADTTNATPKIASFNLASDEIIWEMLGQCKKTNEIVALSSLAGDSKYSHIDKSIHGLGIQYSENLEILTKLKPSTYILASYNKPLFKEFAAKQKARVVMLEDPISLDSLKKNIKTLSEVTGCEAFGKAMIQRIDDRLADALRTKHRLFGKRVIFFSPPNAVIGKQTMLDDLVTRLGIINQAKELNLNMWSQVSPELFLKHPPDVVIVFSEKDKDLLKKLPGWSKLSAVKNNKILFFKDERAVMAASQYFMNSLDEINSFSLN